MARVTWARAGRWGAAAALASVLAALGGAPVTAAEDHGTFSIQIENDLFGSGSDRNYTHGTRIAVLSAENAVPDWVADAAARMPLFASGARMRVSYELGQNIFTPEDLTRKDLIVNDRPYAGWLYAGVGLVSDTGQRLDNLSLNVGVVGPASFAEDVQKAVHKIIGSTRPQGWDNQLRNEPGIVLTYERKWRALHKFHAAGLGVDITPRLGGAVGNVYTYGAGGATVRIGDDLPNDYGPPRIRPSLPGSDFFIPSDRFGWYLFAGVEGRVVGRNIFLDGNTFVHSHSVHKKIVVGDLQAGIAFTIGDVRLSYTYVLRTPEFNGQHNTDAFGSVNLSFRF